MGLDGRDATIQRRTGNLVAFDSPTHNIGCVIWLDNETGGIARCDISQKAWKPAIPRPRSCDGDFGGGLDVQGSNRGEYLCATDTALGGPGSPVLAYDHGYDVGRFRCVSAVDGMRCENRITGHGFWISRQRAVRF
jgi:hypothetical protein